MALGKDRYRQDKNRREPFTRRYFKSNGGGKWWPNYDGEEDVIIDDLRSATYPFLELLGMTDRYPYTIEDKGTIRQFKARRIIITCPRCPGEEYKWETMEDIGQLTRRIALIEEVKGHV